MHTQEKSWKLWILKTGIASKIEATLKEKNLLQGEQTLSFKSSHYGKEAKYFMLMALYYIFFLRILRTIYNVRNKRYAYEQHISIKDVKKLFFRTLTRFYNCLVLLGFP